jgi:hypothetical protein
MRRTDRREAGAALVLVLLGIFVFVAASVFMIMAVDRNTDLNFAFQRDAIGFHSAEAGIHVGAVGVEDAMLNFQLPTNCSAAGTSFSINGRTVTYALSVPPGAPYNGVAGSCNENPVRQFEAAGPYAGLNSLVYTYNLKSWATNALGFRESSINNQFQSHLIPMFQFAGFYVNDLELEPGPSAVVNGRLHTNGDLYLNNDTCGSAPTNGLNILGRITIVGSGRPGTAPLNRGRKDDTTVNWDNVYISTDGTTGGLQVLGTDAPGSMSCGQVNTRQIGPAEINTFNNRIATNLTGLSVPTAANLLCVPWVTGCSSTPGAYFQNADLRIALDTTQTVQTGATGPNNKIYAVEVLNADGSVNSALTAALTAFMSARPGAITYSDVPQTSEWNCDYNNGGDQYCELQADGVTVTPGGYADPSAYQNPTVTNYAQTFPKASGGCPADRSPRQQITAANYCGDYRYGGFFNWREHKPVLMLNIDWMALEEYNDANGNVFFDPTVNVNGGLLVFLTVKDTTGTEGLNANNYGVRLYDAGRARRNLADPGVTFASDQAMYVAGNFNCPQPNTSGGITVPAACGDAAWPPTSSSTYQKGTSLIGDSINVLSCNTIAAQAGSPCGSFSMNADQWGAVCGNGCRPADEATTTSSGTILNGTVSCGGAGCTAADTIVNAGFLGGVDRTWCSGNPTGTNCGGSYYSGGMENYPRFHEDWSGGVQFWYQGSLVAIGQPNHTCFAYTAQFAPIGNDPNYTCAAYPLQGFWATQRYSPPTRHWFYDVSFNNAAYLPPFTPRFVYLYLLYFTQIFQ